MYQRMEFPSIEHCAWSIWNRNHILMTFKNEQRQQHRQQHRHPIKKIRKYYLFAMGNKSKHAKCHGY